MKKRQEKERHNPAYSLLAAKLRFILKNKKTKQCERFSLTIKMQYTKEQSFFVLKQLKINKHVYNDKTQGLNWNEKKNIIHKPTNTPRWLNLNNKVSKNLLINLLYHNKTRNAFYVLYVTNKILSEHSSSSTASLAHVNKYFWFSFFSILVAKKKKSSLALWGVKKLLF